MVVNKFGCGFLQILRYREPCVADLPKSTQDLLAEWFGIELEDMPWFAPSYNVAPQSTQPVVRQNRDTGKREFTLLRWGVHAIDKFGYSTINARAEEAASKPAFRDALKKRCLVPADTFYEWQRLDPKTKRPFAFRMKSGEPYALAGLWEKWQGKNNEALETFSTILTTDPNELMEPVHNRMPVILEPKDYDRSLDTDSGERTPVRVDDPSLLS